MPTVVGRLWKRQWIEQPWWKLAHVKKFETGSIETYTGLILGLRPANERRRLSLAGRKPRISHDITNSLTYITCSSYPLCVHVHVFIKRAEFRFEWVYDIKAISLTLQQLSHFSFFKILFYFLMLFTINVTHLHEISPIYWIFNHRCGYWWWFSTMESVGHSAELFKGRWHIEGALVLNEVRNVAIVNTNVNQHKAFYVNCNNLHIGTEAMESRRYTTRIVIFTQIPSSL